MKTTTGLVFLAFAFCCTITSHAQIVQTLNLDFGNGSVYIGDDGVFSSPGGTHWNKVNIDSNGIVPLYSFHDEFNQPFIPNNNYLFTEVYGEAFFFSSISQANTSIGTGPLSDGVTISNGNGLFHVLGLAVREFSRLAPVDVVVYFNNPDAPNSSTSQLGFAEGFWNFSGMTVSANNPTGAFPGVAGADHLQFNNVPLIFTTLGTPPTMGIGVYLPPGATAHIAAMQIRGHFGNLPEPSSIALVSVLVCSVVLSRRRPASV